MIHRVLARFPCSLYVLILCIGVVAARTAAPASGPAGRDTPQIGVGDKQGEPPKLAPDLTFRTRVLTITPAHDVKIDWRYGGEAQGGQVYRGTLANGLAIGQWTPGTPLAGLAKGPWPPTKQGWWYITFTVNDAASRDLRMEFGAESLRTDGRRLQPTVRDALERGPQEVQARRYHCSTAR